MLNTVLAGWLFGLMFFDPAGKPTVPSLGLITGFHIAWNYFLGFVLCLPVSGISVHWHWTTFEPANATWSGGQYGLEASLAFPFVGGALVIFQALRLRRLRAQRA